MPIFSKNKPFQLIIIFNCLAIVVWLLYLGVFSPRTVFTKIEGTTGPDYTLVWGGFKLGLPDSVKNRDYSGIMITENSRKFINKKDFNKILFVWDYYYIIGGDIVGHRNSDGDAQHPLIEVHTYRYLHEFTFWIVNLILFLPIIVYIKQLMKKE